MGRNQLRDTITEENGMYKSLRKERMKNLKRRQLKQDWITRLVTQQNNTQYSKEPHEEPVLSSLGWECSAPIVLDHNHMILGGRGAGWHTGISVLTVRNWSTPKTQDTQGMRPPHQLHPLPQ